MRNSLLKLCALVALTVLGNGAGFVACGPHDWDDHEPYTPFKISVDSVEAGGQLSVADNEELFFLFKGNELILEIQKYEEVGIRGFKIFGNHDRVLDETLPIDERMVIDHIIQLSSNNPEVWIRGRENRRITNKRERTELTTTTPQIHVHPLGLRDVAISAGVFGQAVAVTIIRLELDGKIDDQPFSIMGRVIYDNTEQSRLAYDEKIQALLEAAAINRAEIRSQQLNRQLKELLPFAVAAILIVATIWLVFRLKRSKR